MSWFSDDLKINARAYHTIVWYGNGIEKCSVVRCYDVFEAKAMDGLSLTFWLTETDNTTG